MNRAVAIGPYGIPTPIRIAPDRLPRSGAGRGATRMSAIQHLISPKASDIGFPVLRLLPAATVQAVGPFVFFDHMGPA